MFKTDVDYEVVVFSIGDTKAGTKMGKLQLKDLSDNVKLELITLLSSSMTRTEKDIKKDASEKLEAALQKFNSDWGGDGSALEISHELREGIENSRTVEEW